MGGIAYVSKKNEALLEAASNLYIANSDEIVRQQCRAREDAERRERTLERNNRLLKEKLEKVQRTLVEKDDALNAKNKALDEKESVIAQKDLEILRLKTLLENKE